MEPSKAPRPPGVRGVQPKRCKVCARPAVGGLVDKAIEQGESDNTIFALLLRAGLTRTDGPFPPGVIAWHRMGGEWCEAGKKNIEGTAAAREVVVVPDLATLVRDKAVKMVQQGKLKPTLQHGLMAQALLDKRVERAADRQLALTVAGMLAGTPAPNRVIVVGPARDDDDDPLLLEDPDDLGFPD